MNYQKIYNPNTVQGESFGVIFDKVNKNKTTGVMNVMSVKCPVCRKRVFDIKKGNGEFIEIQLKCPHCRKIVDILIRSV